MNVRPLGRLGCFHRCSKEYRWYVGHINWLAGVSSCRRTYGCVICADSDLIGDRRRPSSRNSKPCFPGVGEVGWLLLALVRPRRIVVLSRKVYRLVPQP